MNLSTESSPPEAERILPLKILVADDDMLNRRLMQLLLVHEGHNVDVVSNGLEAFDAVKFQKFDMVLMDLHMPVMDGIEASNRIREWEDGGPRTFIVALTGSYMPDEGHRLFEAGMDNYLAKPFDMKHLQRMLKYRADAIYASSKGTSL